MEIERARQQKHITKEPSSSHPHILCPEKKQGRQVQIKTDERLFSFVSIYFQLEQHKNNYTGGFHLFPVRVT